jgi:membrane protein
MLVLLLGLLRYTGLQAQVLLEALAGYIPEALLPHIKRIVLSTYENTSGAVLSVSALAALWSAGRGIYGLLTGLNAVYRVSESRGYWYTRSISALYTFLFLLVLLLTLVLNVFGRTLLQLLEASSDDFLDFLTDVVDLRFLLLLCLQTALFCTMYMVLPNRKNPFRESLPGALLASFGWIVFSHLYSIYVEYFPSYANIYGSVYALALCMLWLYFCISIVFYGGALNDHLARRKNNQ